MRGADDRPSSRRPRLREIKADPAAARLRLRAGRARRSRENCAPCHGAGGGGAKGYPNLNDDDWLWGGTLERDRSRRSAIGVRSGRREGAREPDAGLRPRRHAQARRDRRRRRTTCARSPACRRARRPTWRAGKKIFADNCAVCHGDDGKGNKRARRAEPDRRIWLYGSDKAAIVEGISNGRGGVMPAWAGRLDRCHHQGARRLRALARRRGEVIHGRAATSTRDDGLPGRRRGLFALVRSAEVAAGRACVAAARSVGRAGRRRAAL